jgi:nucleotide-binding universal stress UspA family protein
MKTILIPIDYSDASKNASLYGIELARFMKAKVVLFHSYHIPVPATEVPILISYDELEKENVNRLNTEKRSVDPSNELDIECVALAGFAVDNIVEVQDLNKPDLIIMGMRGAGKFSEYLLGSITTAFISKTETPIIVVPEKAAFHFPKKITFACDYKLSNNANILAPLKKFAKMFNSEVMILNLLKENEMVNSEKAFTGIIMEYFIEDINHKYYFEEDENFIHGIINFVEKHSTDLIAIIPHKHSFIKSLFNESHTKKLAFHTNIPLLVIPEMEK